MNLFQQFVIQESQKAAQAEIDNSIAIINKIYNEWKKTGRRVNAVDIITTSVNKISTINPEVIDKIHETAKLKIATIIMRCLDLPPWKDVMTKRSTYKKLYPIIKKIQTFSPNTGSGGNLREVIMTRLSAAISHQSKSKIKVFVAYEPIISTKYMQYLFHSDIPEKTFKMQALSLPEDFETLVDTLKLNQNKAEKKISKSENI